MTMTSNGINKGNGYVAAPASAATRLRCRLQDDHIIVAPGVYEGFSARIAHEVGFDCIYMVRHNRAIIPLGAGDDSNWV